MSLLPAHLASDHAKGGIYGEPVAQYEIGNYKNFVYLIIDWAQAVASIVDPQNDLSLPEQFLAKHRITLTSILLTHTHFDHIAGVGKLRVQNPKIPIFVHPSDAHRLKGQAFNAVCDEQEISVGKLKVKVLHTPGHSPGECCYVLRLSEIPPFYLFSGDTLFIRDCGRTDLEGGSDEQMFETLQRLKTLPDETLILPGHHYQKQCASTLGDEKQSSPPLACRSIQELKELP